MRGHSIQANDNRLLDVEDWGGRLWATHMIGCNPGGGTVNCVRWYEIRMTRHGKSLRLAMSGCARSWTVTDEEECDTEGCQKVSSRGSETIFFRYKL